MVVGGADTEVGVPVRRSPAIVSALRVAYRYAFIGGDGGPSGVIADAPGTAPVAVQHKYQRRSRRQVRRKVEVVRALDAAVFEGLLHLGIGRKSDAKYEAACDGKACDHGYKVRVIAQVGRWLVQNLHLALGTGQWSKQIGSLRQARNGNGVVPGLHRHLLNFKRASVACCMMGR